MKLSHLIKVLNEYKESFDKSNYDPDVVIRTDDFEERDLFDDFCVSVSSNRDGQYLCLFTYDENTEIKETIEPEKEPLEELEEKQMTKEEFNEKYKDYIEEGHPGMELTNKTLIWYIDKAFEDIIKIPNFKFKTISYDYGEYCVWSNLKGLDDILEDGIQNAYNTIKQFYEKENIEDQQRRY